MKIYFPKGKKVYANFNGFTYTTDQPVKSGGKAPLLPLSTSFWLRLEPVRVSMSWGSASRETFLPKISRYLRACT